jgi:hypothetical protein
LLSEENIEPIILEFGERGLLEVEHD